jgi:hypothetical protein
VTELKKIVMTAVLLCAIALTGCNGGNTDKGLPATGGERHTAIPEETPISEAFNQKDQQIWYSLSPNDGTPGKDSIPTIYVFQDGNAQVYKSNGLTMSEITKMSDGEIIKNIKEPEKSELSDSIDKRIQELKQDKERDQKMSEPLLNSSQIDAAIAALEKARTTKLKVEPQPYTLNIETDSTGNRTERESLTFDTYFISLPDYSMNEIGDEYFSDTVELKEKDTENLYFSSGYAKFEVYDQWFTGVYLTGLGKEGNYFVTRDPEKNGELSFILDQPGAKGVTIDE